MSKNHTLPNQTVTLFTLSVVAHLKNKMKLLLKSLTEYHEICLSNNFPIRLDYPIGWTYPYSSGNFEYWKSENLVERFINLKFKTFNLSEAKGTVFEASFEALSFINYVDGMFQGFIQNIEDYLWAANDMLSSDEYKNENLDDFKFCAWSLADMVDKNNFSVKLEENRLVWISSMKEVRETLKEIVYRHPRWDYEKSYKKLDCKD